MKTIRPLAYLAVLVLLQACASMGKDECVNADWHTIGYEDGARGLAASQISEHRKDCAEYGVTPDLQAYLAGRDQGLTQYCKADNGFHVGASGGQYAGVCPRQLENRFLDGYRAGHQLYVLEAALNSVQYQLDSRRHELEHVKKRLAEKSADLIGDKTTTEERINLVADISNLNDRKNRLEQEIAALEQDRDARAADLDAYQANLSRR